MLFNCFNCCKAISTHTKTCPYCMIETTGMVMQMEPEKPAQERWGFLLKRSAYKAERATKELSDNLANIPNLIQKVRIVNR